MKSIWDNSGSSGGGYSGNRHGSPNVFEMIFTDVETEGKERGYAGAAKEYEGKFNKLKTIADRTV